MMKRWGWLCAIGAAILVAGSCVPDGGTNQLPVAHATATPSSGVAPLVVAFSSAGSADPDGVISSYLWDFGDSTPTSSAANPSHTYTAGGTFTATLIVTDNGGATGTTTVTVTVGAGNAPPTAVAGATPTSGPAPLSVTFSSTGSDDSDGTVVGYDWDFGDLSPHSSDASPSHTYSAAGAYVATLTVIDNEGATNTASVTITVGSPPANTAPTAILNLDVDTGRVGLVVHFNSASSVDPDVGDSIASVDWDFGDSTAHSTAANPTHTYTVPGDHTVVLTVTDTHGASDTDTHVVHVAPNIDPIAHAAGTPTSGNAPLTVSFSSAGSNDNADGTIVGYDWDFGDGSAHSTAANPTHTYQIAGTFTATLTVTDNDGGTGTDTVTIDSIGGIVSPQSGPAGTVITVVMPCSPIPGHPLIATAVVAFATTSNTVLATNSVDNSGSGDPNATVTVTVPPGTAPGSYKVLSSCDLYMTTTTYAPTPFTVT